MELKWLLKINSATPVIWFLLVYFSLLAYEIIWNVIRGLTNNLPVAFRAAQAVYAKRFTPRWKTCNLLTNTYFTYATTLLYVNKHLSEDARKTVRYVYVVQCICCAMTATLVWPVGRVNSCKLRAGKKHIVNMASSFSSEFATE
jgi:hypothetical protein